MARDTTDERPIEGKQPLIDWLAQGCKPKQDWRIGTEHEKFGFFVETLDPIPYHGERGIEAILLRMKEKLGWEGIVDQGNIIGLYSTEGGGAISLEPGGQFELSGAPLSTIHETCRESNQHLRLVKEIADEMDIGFLGLGASPLWTFSQTPQMPKSRYNIMKNYMPKVGSQGHDMMFRTCTIQVNLDFDSEMDMRRKLQTSLKLQPVATALFANSPFTEGKPNGLLSWRADIWRDVDNQRGGYHPFMLEEGFGFERYVEWALDVPMYFVIRDGKYHDCTHITFRQFMDGALKGEVSDPEPTMGDWANHMSTIFPDVRLKRFLEMRGADGGPWRRICALPALWVGLLYSSSALDAAETLCANWTPEMVGQLRDEVPRLGLNAEVGGRKLLDVANEVVGISRDGLKERDFKNSEGQDEAHFLAPLEESIASGLTPAEVLLQKFNGPWGQSMEKLFDEQAY